MLQRYINYEYERTNEIAIVETFPKTFFTHYSETFQETSLLHHPLRVLRNKTLPIGRFGFAEDHLLLQMVAHRHR